MRVPPFQSDPLVEWPKWLTKVYAKAHPLLWLALILALMLIPIALKAATVSIAGKTCALSGATYQPDTRFTVYTCGTVYLSGFAGATFDGDVFVIAAVSSVDRIKFGSFEP